MRVLVTGGAGHIGSAIVERLVADGHAVVDLDCAGAGRTGRECLREDIASEGFVQRVSSRTEPCEAVVHSAALLAMDLCALDVTRVNCIGTHSIINLARAWSSRRMIYISSIQVVGLPLTLPITEEHELSPRTVYHASKLYGEHLVSLASGEGLSAMSLRVTSPVGPGTPGGRIFSVFATRAASGLPLLLSGSGLRRQNYVDTRDVARAVSLSLKSTQTGVLNIGSASSVSNRELAEVCKVTTGSSSSIVMTGEDDLENETNWDVSIGEAERQLGYRPKVTLSDSVIDYLDSVCDERRQLDSEDYE